MPEPTEQDKRNAETRAAIAAKQQAEYDQVLLWAMGKFGTGWLPSGRHFLVDKDEEDARRKDGGKPRAAATVYTVRHRQTGSKRHFTVDAEGRVTEHASYKEAFGPMLLEPHPTQTIEVRGEIVHPHRYSLCWAPIETYSPRSAEELAALRVSREAKKAEREEEAWRRENPLLAWAEKVKRGEEERER